jgi:hypothetical protein
MIKKNIVSYFPARAYDGIDDLAETITNPANCCSLTMIHFIKHNIIFAHTEPVYIYKDIKQNLVGDSYVRLLTSLHFPSDTGYHRFDYPLYKNVEHSYSQLRFVYLWKILKMFKGRDIPCLVILNFKKNYPEQ